MVGFRKVEHGANIPLSPGKPRFAGLALQMLAVQRLKGLSGDRLINPPASLLVGPVCCGGYIPKTLSVPRNPFGCGISFRIGAPSATAYNSPTRRCRPPT